jgi:hypothetical protein
MKLSEYVCIMNQIAPVRTVIHVVLVTDFTLSKRNVVSVMSY